MQPLVTPSLTESLSNCNTHGLAAMQTGRLIGLLELSSILKVIEDNPTIFQVGTPEEITKRIIDTIRGKIRMMAED